MSIPPTARPHPYFLRPCTVGGLDCDYSHIPARALRPFSGRDGFQSGLRRILVRKPLPPRRPRLPRALRPRPSVIVRLLFSESRRRDLASVLCLPPPEAEYAGVSDDDDAGFAPLYFGDDDDEGMDDSLHQDGLDPVLSSGSDESPDSPEDDGLPEGSGSKLRVGEPRVFDYDPKSNGGKCTSREVAQAAAGFWVQSASEVAKQSEDVTRQYAHAARIMETTAGKRLFGDRRCKRCRTDKLECWVYSKKATKQINKAGQKCARCRVRRSKAECKLPSST